ncbi:MAG: hypothetical protein SNJ56_02210 [Termitinemataceae bacterium]
MKIRIHVLPLIVLLFVIALLNSLQGLAGPLSRYLQLFPLLFLIFSVLQASYSYAVFGFHQEFSTDHPVRGETVRYSLVIFNHGLIPACETLCEFSFVGPGLSGTKDFSTFLGSGESETVSFEFRCAYRGVYSLGARRFVFRDLLGILRLEYTVEPRTFYVYPELVPLGQGLETLVSGTGDRAFQSGGIQVDPGVFDSIQVLRHGEGGRPIAWKRFAATGIPCSINEGKSSAPFLRLILDLRPLSAGTFPQEEILQAEDLAVSLFFSVARYLVAHTIPAELLLGSSDEAFPLLDMDAFTSLYEQSTSLLFTDTALSLSASRGDAAILFITVHSPFEETSTGPSDLFSFFESRLRRGLPSLYLIVPPPSRFQQEQERWSALLEEWSSRIGLLPYRVVDSRQGSEGFAHVFE